MADTGSIRGTALSQQDGQPLEGVQLTLTGGGGSHEQTTGAKGLFDFPDLEAGDDYELQAEKKGFHSGDYGPLMVMEGEATEIRIALEPVAG